MYFHDTRDAEVLRSFFGLLDKMDPEPYDTCSESGESENSGEYRVQDYQYRDCGDEGRLFVDMNSTEADINHIWRQCQATFRRSRGDLLSDYVDPVAELHMTLPEWWSHEGKMAVETQPAENGGWECLAHHRDIQDLQRSTRRNKRTIRTGDQPIARHQNIVRM